MSLFAINPDIEDLPPPKDFENVTISGTYFGNLLKLNAYPTFPQPV